MGMKTPYEKVVDWLVPILLGGAVHLMSQIKDEMAAVGSRVAVVTQQIGDNERRINILERSVSRLGEHRGHKQRDDGDDERP